MTDVLPMTLAITPKLVSPEKLAAIRTKEPIQGRLTAEALALFFEVGSIGFEQHAEFLLLYLEEMKARKAAESAPEVPELVPVATQVIDAMAAEADTEETPAVADIRATQVFVPVHFNEDLEIDPETRDEVLGDQSGVALAYTEARPDMHQLSTVITKLQRVLYATDGAEIRQRYGRAVRISIGTVYHQVEYLFGRTSAQFIEGLLLRYFTNERSLDAEDLALVDEYIKGVIIRAVTLFQQTLQVNNGDDPSVGEKLRLLKEAWETELNSTAV